MNMRTMKKINKVLDGMYKDFKNEYNKVRDNCIAKDNVRFDMRIRLNQYMKKHFEYLGQGATRYVYRSKCNKYVLKIGLYHNTENKMEERFYKKASPELKALLAEIVWKSKNILIMQKARIDNSCVQDFHKAMKGKENLKRQLPCDLHYANFGYDENNNPLIIDYAGGVESV